MVMMAVDPTFVDTNVLVNASLTTAPFRSTAVQALANLRMAGVELWISRQSNLLTYNVSDFSRFSSIITITSP